MSRNPHDVEDGRVPIGELGAYATIGKMDNYAVQADADGTVEVCSPFVSVTFGHLPAAEQDVRMAVYACQVLRKRDREISDQARSWGSYDENLRRGFALRAGAALWLYRRDLRRFTHACTGVAAGWTLHPTCKGYNSDAYETDLRVGTRTSRELDVNLVMHVLEGGVFRRAGYVNIMVYNDSGVVQTSGTFSGGTSELDRALHAEMVSLARRLAEEQYEAEVARAQARLDHLRSRLALVQPSSTKA